MLVVFVNGLTQVRIGGAFQVHMAQSSLRMTGADDSPRWVLE